MASLRLLDRLTDRLVVSGYTMRVMNAYVNYFDTDGARARANLQAGDIRDDETVVQFSESPHHWKMGLSEAQANCDLLNRANVYAKNRPEHRCHFEVERVSETDYAIVCKTHPQFMAQGRPVDDALGS